MGKIFVSLQDAARFEEQSYVSIRKSVQREKYITRQIPRPGGGRPLREVALSSLSPEAQERYRMEQAAPALESVIAEKTAGEKKWYETIDRVRYRSEHAAEYAEKAELVRRLRACMAVSRSERQAAIAELAEELHMTARTIQGYIADITDADYRAQRYQRERKEDTSLSMDFQTLALCRKPREKDSFAQLTDEMRALIENIYADREFAKNNPTRELMADKFMELAKERGMEDLPSRYAVKRYLKYVSEDPKYRDAHNLAALGRREYENHCGLKTRRSTTAMKVMEVVMGDGHTLDCWVKGKDRKGQERALRPTLIAWIDVKTRRIMGGRLCPTGNYDMLKESFFKMVYQDAHSIPQFVYIDNGKDYTSKAMMGQTKKERREHSGEAEAAINGYYSQMGVQGINVAIPYHAWSKGQIERSFGTLCERFSKQFTSYTGTLTGSKTSGKIPKDIEKMFREGQLMTMEEAQEKIDAYIEAYNHTPHRALKDAGEAWTKPAELFEHGERYRCAPPPKQYAIEIMKQDDVALVRTTGINKFKRRYFNAALAPYIGQKVNVKYDPDDRTKLWIYDQRNGSFICIAEQAQDMGFGVHADAEALAEHRRMQNQQIRNAAETLRWLQTPYEERTGSEPRRRTQSLDGLMYAGSGNFPQADGGNIVTMPQDREWNGGAEVRKTERRKNAKHFTESNTRAIFDYLNQLDEFGEV